MELKPHQQRVVAEKADLDEKLKKLIAFLWTDAGIALETEERTRLERQCKPMKAYSKILGERIAAFNAVPQE